MKRAAKIAMIPTTRKKPTQMAWSRPREGGAAGGSGSWSSRAVSSSRSVMLRCLRVAFRWTSAHRRRLVVAQAAAAGGSGQGRLHRRLPVGERAHQRILAAAEVVGRAQEAQLASLQERHPVGD